jgi:flagellar motor switch protein FliN/FliY
MSNGAQQMSDPVRSLLDQWTASIAQVLESMMDQKPEVRWESGITLASDPEALWWEQHFRVAPDVTVWVAAPQRTWEYTGTETLRGAGLETIEVSEARNTWLEILSQSLSTMARSIGAILGREVTCEPGIERAPISPPDIGSAVAIKFSEVALPPLWIGFSPKLVSMLSSPPLPAEVQEERADVSQAEPAARRSSAPPTMELILDVELPVSISFGKTELAMKDVLKLTMGSIVELNRGVGDPVEIMINHCLIARGEVVVVEGNYGVRIQHIASRADRLRSVR